MATSVPTRGMILTTTDTTNIKLDISDAIDFLSPYDVPLMDMVGRASLHTPCTQILHEWLEDTLSGRSGTLLSAYTAGSGTMTLNTNEGKYLVPDDLIRSAGIVFRVTGGAPDSDTLTVSVVGGLSDANIAASTAWSKLAHASQQGGVARNDARKTTLVKPFNYPQIYKDWAVVSGTMEVIDRYGYANERAYQEEKVLKQLAIDTEHNLIYGVRSYNAGPPIRYTSGGIFDYVRVTGTNNSWVNVHNAASAQLTETMFVNVLEEIWNQGGRCDLVQVNSYNKRVISTWGSPRIRTTQDEKLAGQTIEMYESDFGTIEIRLNRNVDASDVIFNTIGELGVGPLEGRQFSSRYVPSSLDGTWYEILGEYTMEVHRARQSHGWIYNTATSG